MTKLTTERLEKKIKSCIEIENCEVMMPLSAAQELLAFRNAAKNPIAWVVGDEEIADFKNGREVCVMRDCDDEQLDYLPLYAEPVLPKQPVKPVMFIDGDISSDDAEKLAAVIREFGNEPAPAQPVIPRELRSFVTDADIAALHRFAECCDDPESGGHDLEKEQVQRLEKIGALQRSGRISYITDFGDYLISVTAPVKAQQNEPQNIPENISTARSEYISFDALMSAVSEVTGVKREFDATPDKCHQILPFMNFNSLSRIVEMFRTSQPDIQLAPHVYRELVNDLRDVALEYHDAQQLRERISGALSKAVTAVHPHLAQPVIPKWPSDEVERDALRYHFLRDKDEFGAENEPGLVGWVELMDLGYDEFDAAVDARIAHPDIDYIKLDTALRKHIPAQPVSEPKTLPSGYALVPVEPTAGMINVGISEAMKLNANVRMVYQAMLAAAPAQESE